MSGKSCERVLLVTASARSCPASSGCMADASVLQTIGVWPATAEAIAGAAPLKGTCTRSSASDRRSISPKRWACVPTPPEAKLYFPGLDLISVTSLFEVARRQRRVNRYDVGRGDRQRDRGEVLVGVEWQFGKQ